MKTNWKVRSVNTLFVSVFAQMVFPGFGLTMLSNIEKRKLNIDFKRSD